MTKVSCFWVFFVVVVVVAGFVLWLGFGFFCNQENLVASPLPLLRVYCSALGITCNHVFDSRSTNELGNIFCRLDEIPNSISLTATAK